ncbi:serine protease HTRA1B-like isoform X1 [Abrus precatorius]|uniref:Serine protease HTRA1B-like isoform X1 n=1 Tax=Abrus precatorius TaxID=3816 RepID=A0A8B8L9A5_ABRPR|nr:serine protease HTRA1B-like isoform X1 [Abrus precatorius]
MLAPYSYRVSSIHLSHITKEASGDVCDGSRPCNCFGRDTIANAVAKVAPAVVYISFPEDYRGIYTGTRECTGTIINKDGTILTCAHMFDPKRHWGSHGKIEVILQDGRRFQGNILDADMHADIAILKINSEIPLPVAKLGSSSGLHPGDWVISLGNHNTLMKSISSGIVSCPDRKNSDLNLSGMPSEYIQTDCVLSPGGSGSPLVNMDGEVVGVCLMTVEGARAFSFAVPIDAVHKITEQFKKSGINPISWSDISKEPSGAFCDESKPHGCFGRHAIASAVAKVGPSVVSITAPLDFFGIPTGTSRGTGTIVYKDGIILTSAHVVDFQSMIGSCRGKVEVTLQDGKTFKGRVLHADRDSDIAIVDINPESPLPEAKIGSSSGLRPGDWVIGLGCPPTLEITATTGIVSCTDRTSEELHSSGMPRKFIQTDCACHVGYSGGPLVNMDGEVIGLNIMKVKDVDGFCFSLPIDFVCKTVEHFKKSRR